MNRSRHPSRVHPGATLILLVMLVAVAGAEKLRLAPVDGALRHGHATAMTSSRVDTVYLLGGKDRLDGRFENAGGAPDWNGWTSRDLTNGVGDFAALYQNLQDEDPCFSNFSAQVAFIDDGVVVPGTGGTPGITWRYGPGGYIVNNSGGLLGDGHAIRNIVESPVLEWPEGCDAARLEFGVFQHLFLDYGGPLISHVWGVRSTTDPIEDPLDAKPYRDRNFIYLGGPNYVRQKEVVGDLLETGRLQVQVCLGVRQYDPWGWDGDDGTPAPYLDNVALLAWSYGGPQITARQVDLPNDGFPASGDLDLVDLGSNSVRIDMAQNVGFPSDLEIIPGDSVVATVAVVSPGAVLIRPPRLVVSMRANPLFDPYRSAIPPTMSMTSGHFADGWSHIEGHVEGSRIFVDGAPTKRYAFDLPDAQFFFPGDEIHFLVEAGDILSAQERWSVLPADTTDFDRFDEHGKYDRDFRVRALRAVWHVNGDQPEILVWDDAHPTREFEFVHQALNNLGFNHWDYDLYTTRAAASGVGNGLGSRATSAQLAAYSTLLYLAGDMSSHLLTNGDLAHDGSNDLGVLTNWLGQGDKNAILIGDNVASDLLQSGTDGAAFLNAYLSVQEVWPGAALRELIGYQVAPLVVTIPGNGVVVTVEEWIAYGGCPVLREFDAVEPLAAAQRLAEYTDADGNAGVFPFAAAVYHQNPAENARFILVPYGFASIRNAPGWEPPSWFTAPARVFVLSDMLERFGQGGGGIPIGVPDAPAFTLRNFPNPFNPATTFALDLPRAAEVSLVLYNLKGERVRVLVDGRLGSGHHDLVWDGRDDAGATVASGVYFARTRALGSEKLTKVTVLK